MKIATFYADCKLPDVPLSKQQGFDWRWAIGELRRTAAKQRMQTLVVTDKRTEIDAWLRTGDAMQTGIMLWLLEAQLACIREAKEPTIMVSPDSLIAAPLDPMFGDWDLCLLTRKRPKPIVNSVIAFRSTPALVGLWEYFVEVARALPADSQSWGADIDALVTALEIKPHENGIREAHGVKIRFMPMECMFASVVGRARRMPFPIWDFKGSRKKLMRDYARLL